VEESIRLVELGRLEIPPDADVASFLLSDGKLNGKPRAVNHRRDEELADAKRVLLGTA